MKYNLLADKYDALVYDVDYDKIADFYKNIIRKYDIQVRDILELGSGTGNITEKFIGYNIFAIDISDEMLSVARAKFQGRRNVSMFNMDIRNFQFNKRFDLCIASLDVINYIHKEEDIKKIFQLTFDHLKGDSLFIFDINSKYKIENYIGNNVFTDEVEDVVYIWQGNYNEKTKINENLLTFFIKDEKDKYDRFSEVHAEKAYDEIIIKNMLIEVGFDEVELFDDFTLKTTNENSLRISFVAYKKGE
ncbi:MAG: class I SAM-dependent methyltransferase [Tissierellia bacterium]|nr:class I SAM-dependent methyltransferase [Tissierellia bacterium]